ncbi:MAG: hypothetical protein M0T83_06380 [Nitrospiraceae bacterium]|nr:hypothetical protein [Nitrospiraceae bacterium]
MAILEIVRTWDQVRQSRRGTGRPPHEWPSVVRTFVAKAILNLSSTRALIGGLQADGTLRRIPEREVPAARVGRFPGFRGSCPDRIPEPTHAALDASAIFAREKARKTRKSVALKIKRKRGVPPRGETVPPSEVSGVKRQFGDDAPQYGDLHGGSFLFPLSTKISPR